MKQLLFVITIFLSFINHNVLGQTTLSAGEIAITGFHFDATEEFSFVLLTDITTGTVINFTDNGWLSSGSFRGGEGTCVWTATSNMTCGTEIVITGTSATAGNVSSNSLGLSSSGDQIIAYQGTSGSPTNIYAVNSEGTGWQANATSSNTSAIPSGLTNGTNAVALNEIDNSVYNCAVLSDQTAVLAAVSNSANWSGSNSALATFPAGCAFSCGTACTAPTTQPSNLTFGAVTSTTIPVSWTDAGDGTGQIVVIREGGAVNANPVSGTTYTADNDWTGTPDEIGTGNFVVYTGNAGPVTVNNLNPNTTYHFAIYEYNTVDDCYYLTSPLTGNITTLCDDPTTQPSAVNFASVTSTGMTVNWTGGNGTNSIVVVHEGAAVDSDPVDGVSYTADTDFSGTPDEIGTGNFVVYTGTLNTVAITGLDPETTYHVAVYEFNSASGCYNTVGEATNNQLTPCPSPPDNVTGFAVTAGNTEASITWTNPTFCFDELLIVAEDGTIGFSPSGDGTAYTANSVYGSGTCVNCTGANNEYAVYKGTGTSVTVTGLTNGDSYCFKVWTRNGTDWSAQDVVCSIVPVATIPDNGCGTSTYLTSTFTYSGTGPIADIDVSVFIEHPFRGDLVIDVISPTGTIVTILSSQGGGADDLEATFDDASANTTYTANHTLDATIDETFQPNGGTLSTFNGENPDGVWTLRICDDANADIGTLNNWFPTIVESCTATHTVTGIAPSSGPIGSTVTVTGTGFTGATTATIGGVAASVTFVSATSLQVEIPVGAATNTIEIIESACPVSSATFTIIGNAGGCAGATAFTDLIISEVYDSDANNVWLIELFNPTASAINLATENYTIERYATAFAGIPSRIVTLTGTVAAGAVFLVNIGTTADPCGATFDFTESGGGINEDDGIMLVKNGTDVDAVVCPGSTGYTLLRDPTASGPTATYAAADWTDDLTEECTDFGSFVLPTPPPTIDTDPADVFACAQDMTIAASAGNAGALTYQWLYNDGSAAGWSNVNAAAFPSLTVSGETSVNLTIDGTPANIATIDTYQFYCEVTEGGTCSATSEAAQFNARTADDPQLITAMINSCDADCGTEGENEYVILSLGDADVNVSPANIALSYGTTIGTVGTYTDTYTADAALVTALNTQNAVNGCGSAVFVDAVTTGTLPANSKVIIMDPNICTTAYDFSNFCGSGPIYLLFSTDPTWGSGGNFGNNISGDRFFTLSITDVNGQTVYSEYSYDGSNFTDSDGDFAQFSFCEGPATDYRNDGCEIKTATLPAELIQFDATPNNEIVNLDWTTATEINVSQHIVQRSQDGENFSDLLYVNAKGNSSVNTYYNDIDYQPLNGKSYYRLKTVDFDDSFKLSPIRVVNFENNSPAVLYGNGEWIISYNAKDSYSYELYNVLGERLTNTVLVGEGESKASIDHHELPNGVYFINVSYGNYYKSIKVIK